MATATIAQLATQVGDRLQDPTFTFWLQQFEVYAALEEAMNDLLLLVGRPTIQFNTPITLIPNQVWQPMPPGMLAITNIRTNQYSLWKTSLRSMDYLQASWGPTWECDVDNLGPLRWGPLGFSYFFVHPAPTVAFQVNVSGVTFPVQTAWPPNGTEQSPFHSEVNVALQMYATAYLRLKELGDDAQEGDVLYSQFLAMAQRLTQIEDRRDPIIFTKGLGSTTAPSMVTMR